MTRPRYIFVARLDFQVDPATVDTRYVATHGFTTGAADTPSHTHIPARIKHAGTWKQELFSSTRVSGAVRPSVGEIVLYNDDGGLDEWVDLATAGGKVTVSMGAEGAAYPSGYEAVFVAYLVNVLADFAEVRLRLRDRSYRLDKPVITETFAGTGDLEGPAGFGARKPLVILDPGYVPAVLVDSERQIYCVQSNAADATDVSGLSGFFRVYVGGAEVVRGTNYASPMDLLYTQPSTNEARFWFGWPSGIYSRGPVYFRLGAAPAHDVRVLAVGWVMDPADSEHSAAPGAWTMTSMCRRAGLHDVTPSSMPAGAALDTQLPAQYIADDRTYLDVLQTAAFERQRWFGFDRLDRFSCAALGSPTALEIGETYTDQRTFGTDRMANIRRTYLADMEGPVWQLTVSAGETWPSNFAASGVPDNVRDHMSRTPWHASLTATSDAVRAAHANAVQIELSTPARITVGAVIGRYFLLYGAHRDVLSFDIDLSPANLQLALNDPVRVVMPRFRCNAGRHFRVCSLTIDLAERRINVVVWGGPASEAKYVYGAGVNYNPEGGIGGPPDASLAAVAPGAVAVLQLVGVAGAASSPARAGNAAGVTKVLAILGIPGIASGGSSGATPTESMVIACGDETTPISAGTNKVTLRMPYAFALSAVKASVTTAPTGAALIIDINEAGASILSTKLSIDAGEKTSATAASAVVISDATLAADAEITIDFDQVGSTVAGAGPKVTLIGQRL